MAGIKPKRGRLTKGCKVRVYENFNWKWHPSEEKGRYMGTYILIEGIRKGQVGLFGNTKWMAYLEGTDPSHAQKIWTRGDELISRLEKPKPIRIPRPIGRPRLLPAKLELNPSDWPDLPPSFVSQVVYGYSGIWSEREAKAFLDYETLKWKWMASHGVLPTPAMGVVG